MITKYILRIAMQPFSLLSRLICINYQGTIIKGIFKIVLETFSPLIDNRPIHFIIMLYISYKANIYL